MYISQVQYHNSLYSITTNNINKVLTTHKFTPVKGFKYTERYIRTKQ